MQALAAGRDGAVELEKDSLATLTALALTKSAIIVAAAQALAAELKAAQSPDQAAAQAEAGLLADRLAAAEAQCQHLQALGTANEILLTRLQVMEPSTDNMLPPAAPDTEQGRT